MTAVATASAVILAILIAYISATSGADLQLLVIMALASIGLLVLSPKTAIVILVLMMPFSGATIIPRPIQNGVILGVPLLLFARIAIEWLGGKKALYDLPWQYWLYLAVMFLSVTIGTLHLDEISSYLIADIGVDGEFGPRQYVVGFFAKIIMIAMLPLFAMTFAKDRRDVSWLPIVSLSGAVIFVFAMLYAFVISGASVSDLRANRALFIALGTHSNTIGGVLLIPFAVALFMREELKSRVGKIMLVGVLVVILFGILLTASRGALVGVLAVSAVYVIKYRRLGAATMMVLVGAIGLVLAPDPVKERLLMGFNVGAGQGVAMNSSADEISSGRLAFWTQLAPEVLHNPIFGNGLRSVMWSDYNRFGSGYKVNHPHNMYLEILLDTGLVGLLMTIALWWMVWKKTKDLSREEGLPDVVRAYVNAAPGVFIAYLTFGLTNGHSYSSTDQLHLWLFVAAVLVLPMPAMGDSKRINSERRARMRRMLSTGYVTRS